MQNCLPMKCIIFTSKYLNLVAEQLNRPTATHELYIPCELYNYVNINYIPCQNVRLITWRAQIHDNYLLLNKVLSLLI